MNSLKIEYKIGKDSINKLKSYKIKDFNNEDLHLWVGPDAIMGILIIKLNDKYIFEIPKKAIKILIKENMISESYQYNRFGFNDICLLDFFINIEKSGIKLLQGKKEVNFEFIKHGIDISIKRKEDRLFITFNKNRNGKLDHYLTSYFLNKIEDEPININNFMLEVIRSTNSFLNDLLKINLSIKENEVFNELHINLRKLKKTYQN